MAEKEEDKSAVGRARRVLDGVAPPPLFVVTMVVTVTVFVLETIKGWQALAAGSEGISLYWRLYNAATHDNLETTIHAAGVCLIGGNFVRFLVEVFMLIYDRTTKFNQLRAEARAEGVVEGKAEGRAEGRAEGVVEGRAEGVVEGRAEGVVEGRAEAILEQDRKWRGWVTRRDAALKSGLPFDEPPPAPLD